MVTIVLSLILYNFIFTFQFNFMKELKYLIAQEKLAMNSYKLMEIASKGLKYENKYIPGMITTKKIYGGNKFRSYRTNTKWQFDRSSSYLKFEDYVYRGVNLNTNLALSTIKDQNNDNNKKLYQMKFDSEIEPEFTFTTASNPRYNEYVRLVYSK